MTSKERVLSVFHHGVPDRVPVNYAANPEIDRKLKEHFGLAKEDHDRLKQALKVDFRGIVEVYRGPKLHPDYPERGVISNGWGARRRWMEHETGGYWDFCEFPLADADEETIAGWPMPDPDDFNYSDVSRYCREQRAYAVYAGNPGTADVINGCSSMRGMEQILIDLALDDPAGLLLMRRRAGVQLEILRRTLEAGKGGIDFVWLGEDLGTQIAPLISMETYRKHLKGIHQSFIDLAKSFDLPVMIHTCGSSSWVYEELIRMGVNAVDTLQPEAANMSPEYLKKTFGGRLAFHGCISTAGVLGFGTAEQVRHECERVLEIMKPGGGYCFAPTHAIQDNSPLENVLAMYETAVRMGKY